MNLNEAFRALDALNEDTFSVSDDGIAKLADFQQNDDLEDEIRVIDPDAETEDDLQDSYVGKVIVDCTVCHSKLYKDKEEIELNEDETLANVGEECPFCYTSDGFKIIGEVAAFGGDTEPSDDSDTDAEDMNEAYEDTDGIMGGSKGQKYSDVDLKTYWEKEKDNDPVLKNYNGDFTAWHKDTTSQMKKVNEGLNEFLDANITLDAKGFGGSGNNVSVLGGKLPLSEDEDVEEGLFSKKNSSKKFESVSESVNNVNVETDEDVINVATDDNGKVIVTTEPKDPTESETITPVSPELEAELTDTSTPEEADVDIEEFDEVAFDELGESYLKQVYENVDSYKTVDVKSDDKQIVVEGVIKFDSGASKATTFILEAKDCTRSHTCRFTGANKQLTEGKKAYVVSGKVVDKKFIAESFNYNYRSLVEGVSNCIHGAVSR